LQSAFTDSDRVLAILQLLLLLNIKMLLLLLHLSENQVVPS